MDRIHIELKPLIDKNKKKCYVGKLKGPFTIDCREHADGSGGVAFMIFVSEDGAEELQITSIKDKHQSTTKESKKEFPTVEYKR